MTFASKIMSGLLAFLMFHSPAFGLGGNSETTVTDGKTVTVTVATDGSGDYATLEEARDYVRTLDRSKYDGIDVVIKDGIYQAEKTFALTAEDSGTENCPVRYIGEGDARLYGGVAFTAADFKPLGDGEVVQYFPEEVKDKLVQIDLKQFGFEGSARDLANARSSSKTFLYVNGSKMNEARFPNADTGTIDDYARVGAGSTLDPEWTDPNEYSGDTTADYYVIRYADEYEERVRSWHDIENVYVRGRFTFMWCSDDSTVASLDPTEPVMDLYFEGGYKPREGMIFYWYHIPEELDVPGEYYIDDDLILYYYPMEGHETATYTIPVLDDYLVSLNGVDYVTFDNLSLESSRAGGIIGNGNHITVQNSTVQSVLGAGIYLDGTHITIQNNTVKSTGTTAIKVRGGDEANIIHSENLIYNNYVEDWSNVRGLFEWGIQAMGCGMTVSHNELCNSADWGIETNGVDILVEYNHIYNASLFEDDQAVIHIGGFGMTVRYNYVHDCGFVDKYTDYMGVSGIDSDYALGQAETYGNVVVNVSGYGHLITNSDNAKVHDNLYISCRRGALYFADQDYTNILRDVSSGSYFIATDYDGDVHCDDHSEMVAPQLSDLGEVLKAVQGGNDNLFLPFADSFDMLNEVLYQEVNNPQKDVEFSQNVLPYRKKSAIIETSGADDFNESDHPRDENGQFTEGGGGSGGQSGEPKGFSVGSKSDLDAAVKSGRAKMKLKASAQSKHHAGSKKYNDAIAQGKKVSTLSIPDEEVQSLVTSKSGTGTVYVNRKTGQLKETIDCGKPVGEYVSMSGNKSQTTRLTVHHSKDGYHAVPASSGGKPNEQ